MRQGALYLRHLGAALIAAASLVACDIVAPVQPTLKPQQRPTAAPAPAPVVARPTSQKSASLRSHLNEVQTAQLTQGLLRRDGGGVDTPFTADQLARNFEQIAFFNEYDGNLTGRGGASPLSRWKVPVRMQVIFWRQRAAVATQCGCNSDQEIRRPSGPRHRAFGVSCGKSKLSGGCRQRG